MVHEQTIYDTTFSNFRLRRIIKENHSTAIKKLSVLKDSCENEMKLGNLLLSVGGYQFNIYDMYHYKDHLDLMLHFDLDENDEDYSEFVFGTWLPFKSDLLICIGSEKGVIHIFSFSYSQELFRLYGHTDSIIELLQHPTKLNIILSLSKDGTMRIWDLKNQLEIARVKMQANTMILNPKGSKILFGLNDGNVTYLNLTLHEESSKFVAEIGNVKLLIKSETNRSSVVQLNFVDKNVLCISKSGNITLMDPKSLGIIWKRTLSKLHLSSTLGISKNNKFLAIGNIDGSITILDLETGKLHVKLEHRRSTKPVNQVLFSDDMRSIVYSSGEGFIFKYQDVEEKMLEEWKAWAEERAK